MAEVYAAIREGVPEVIEEPLFDAQLDNYDENSLLDLPKRRFDKLLREFNW